MKGKHKEGGGGVGGAFEGAGGLWWGVEVGEERERGIQAMLSAAVQSSHRM